MPPTFSSDLKTIPHRHTGNLDNSSLRLPVGNTCKPSQRGLLKRPMLSPDWLQEDHGYLPTSVAFRQSSSQFSSYREQVQQALSQVNQLAITDCPWPESEAACNLEQVRKLEPLPDSQTLAPERPESELRIQLLLALGPGTGYLTSLSFDFLMSQDLPTVLVWRLNDKLLAKTLEGTFSSRT